MIHKTNYEALLCLSIPSLLALINVITPHIYLGLTCQKRGQKKRFYLDICAISQNMIYKTKKFW